VHWRLAHGAGLCLGSSCRFEVNDISLAEGLGSVGNVFRRAHAWRLVGELREAGFYCLKFLFGQIIEIEQAVAGVFADTDQLIEFEVQGRCVAVLRILYEEHHKESNNSGAGVDDELPRVGKMKCRTADCPDNDNGAGQDESRCTAALPRGPLGCGVEGFAEREKPCLLLVRLLPHGRCLLRCFESTQRRAVT
jgi:hypothetical protein